MLILFVPCGLWQCCTFKVKCKFTTSTTEYLISSITTTTATMFKACVGEDELVLMTFVDKDFWDQTTLNIKFKPTWFANVNEAIR